MLTVECASVDGSTHAATTREDAKIRLRTDSKDRCNAAIPKLASLGHVQIDGTRLPPKREVISAAESRL